MATDLSNQVQGIKEEYKYGFRDSDANYSFKSRKGLDRQVVEEQGSGAGRHGEEILTPMGSARAVGGILKRAARPLRPRCPAP